LHEAGVGIVQTPPMHSAGDRHQGPFFASQLPKSIAGSLHVPVEAPAGMGQWLVFEQLVIAPLMAPHGCPDVATVMAVQAPFIGLLQ
jgi:hypothetical protein